LAACLKRVHLAARWEELTHTYRAVDWTAMRELRDPTGAIELDPACAGGGCEVSFAVPGRETSPLAWRMPHPPSAPTVAP
jgi:hypothetical protein